MAYTKAQNKATQKYLAKTYDDLRIRVPKGEKEKITNHAKIKDESLNSFVVRSIKETIDRDNKKDGE